MAYDKHVCRDIRTQSNPTLPCSSNTANGVLTANLQVTMTQVKLLMLSKQCKFELTLQIVAQQLTMNYGVMLGLETMKQNDLDTSVCDSSINWSNKVVTLS
jgi:hypothetical protein